MQRKAAERNEDLRTRWLVQLAGLNAKQLLFLDESAACVRAKDRKYGWAPSGVSPVSIGTIRRDEWWSVLPVYSVDGFLIWQLLKGGYNTETFNNFVRTHVLPLCNSFPGPRSVIVVDNASIHGSEVLILLLIC